MAATEIQTQPPSHPFTKKADGSFNHTVPSTKTHLQERRGSTTTLNLEINQLSSDKQGTADKEMRLSFSLSLPSSNTGTDSAYGSAENSPVASLEASPEVSPPEGLPSPLNHSKNGSTSNTPFFPSMEDITQYSSKASFSPTPERTVTYPTERTQDHEKFAQAINTSLLALAVSLASDELQDTSASPLAEQKPVKIFGSTKETQPSEQGNPAQIDNSEEDPDRDFEYDFSPQSQENDTPSTALTKSGDLTASSTSTQSTHETPEAVLKNKDKLQLSTATTISIQDLSSLLDKENLQPDPTPIPPRKTAQSPAIPQMGILQQSEPRFERAGSKTDKAQRLADWKHNHNSRLRAAITGKRHAQERQSEETIVDTQQGISEHGTRAPQNALAWAQKEKTSHNDTHQHLSSRPTVSEVSLTPIKEGICKDFFKGLGKLANITDFSIEDAIEGSAATLDIGEFARGLFIAEHALGIVQNTTRIYNAAQALSQTQSDKRAFTENIKQGSELESAHQTTSLATDLLTDALIHNKLHAIASIITNEKLTRGEIESEIKAKFPLLKHKTPVELHALRQALTNLKTAITMSEKNNPGKPSKEESIKQAQENIIDEIKTLTVSNTRSSFKSNELWNRINWDAPSQITLSTLITQLNTAPLSENGTRLLNKLRELTLQEAPDRNENPSHKENIQALESALATLSNNDKNERQALIKHQAEFFRLAVKLGFDGEKANIIQRKNAMNLLSGIGKAGRYALSLSRDAVLASGTAISFSPHQVPIAVTAGLSTAGAALGSVAYPMAGALSVIDTVSSGIDLHKANKAIKSLDSIQESLRTDSENDDANAIELSLILNSIRDSQIFRQIKAGIKSTTSSINATGYFIAGGLAIAALASLATGVAATTLGIAAAVFGGVAAASGIGVLGVWAARWAYRRHQKANLKAVVAQHPKKVVDFARQQKIKLEIKPKDNSSQECFDKAKNTLDFYSASQYVQDRQLQFNITTVNGSATLERKLQRAKKAEHICQSLYTQAVADYDTLLKAQKSKQYRQNQTYCG